ncbi:hypothetical protein Cgig2_003812 [Carnegiea gigantea]|uniref:Uncharacterized protein n=1 Tax=Carnegiea gigantea TaxID=171969 RepID=A0A9Q1K5K8_9CARY|nr:hypothetical protein Cgig2_003812 [Carnegiea gigantea]
MLSGSFGLDKLYKGPVDLTDSRTASTPYATYSRCTAWFQEQEQTLRLLEETHQWASLVKKQQPMTAAPSHTMRESTASSMRKMVQLRPSAENSKWPPMKSQTKGILTLRGDPREDKGSIEIVATTARGYAEGISHTAWKTQMRGTKQVMIIGSGNPITIPTMVFDGQQGRIFSFPHNDPKVVELKVANPSSSADVITWDRLRKLKYPGRDITTFVHLFLGFGGQEVTLIGMIRLSLRFGDKTKSSVRLMMAASENSLGINEQLSNAILLA